MGIAKTSLEYLHLTTGNWTKAVNDGGVDAVIMLNVEQSINTSAKADIILSNRSDDPTSSDPADAKGNLADVFAEFQRIRLVHQEIGIPIFSGRIYRIRDVYDAQYGQTIRIVAFDALKELREYPIEDAGDSLEEVDTTDADEGGYDLRKRSQVIKYMLNELGLKDKNLLTTDTDHFEDSWSTDSLGDKKLDLTKIDRHVAGVMQDLAIADPVKDSSAVAIGESGYDYRVEPRFLSSAVTHKPIESLNYFMRGTRPGKGGAYGGSAAPILTNTATDSLTIEYTNIDSDDDSGLKQTMMPTYEFDKPKAELYTSVVCHYTDEGKEDESGDDESGGKIEGVVTFELLKGSALSGTFTWATKALDINKKGVVNVPEYLTYGGNNVAVVQWQNTNSKYLMISHIDESTFPTTGVVTLTGASSSATFVFNAATGRMKTKYGVERPVRIQRPMSSDLGIIRDEIVARLVGRTDLVIVRGKFQTVKYPFVYHDLPGNASRSSNTITWSGTVAARTRGVRKGHIVAEINAAGEYVRYAYISAVASDTSITYGSNATDTSDETALDSSNTIRLIIPLRPGDVIKVFNAQSGIESNQVILTLGYDESPGMFAARYETIGSNNKFNNIYAEGEELRTAIAAAAPKKFPDSTKALSETSFFFNGFVNRGSNPSDVNNYRKIHFTNTSNATSGTAGTLTVGDGSKYTIACANSATLTTAEHTIFFRHDKSRATANKSDTTFQIVLTASYNKDVDDILVGWCKASDNKAGSKAVLVLAPQFNSKDLFASGQNGTLTEALLSKSAQEYSSGLEVTAVTSGSDKHRQVTWAACTSAEDRLTFGDGDYWSIAAKSGSNYSVTTNGSTFANITALALSSTYYTFIDTADTASGGTLTLRFTTKYSHISTADDGTFSSSRVIMGQIAVPANGDDGAAPRIFPFNNRSLTINAASIAADAITATHITATAIDTTHLKLSGTNGIGGLTAAGLLNLSFTSGSLSLDNTTNGSNKIAITSAQETDFAAGGDEAGALTAAEAAAAAAATAASNLALGMDANGNIKKNVVVDGTANSPTFYSWSGSQSTPGNLVLVNAQGIAGYTGVSGTYSEGSGSNDGLTLPSDPQFQIRTTDGRGAFGAGKVTLGSDGIVINQVGASNATSFLTFKSTSGSGSHFYRLINAAGYPAHTQLYSAGEDAACHVFITTGTGAGFISAGTSTDDVSIGLDNSYSGFKALYLGNTGKNASGSTGGVPPQTASNAGVMYTKSDGHVYWKGRNSSGSALTEVNLSTHSTYSHPSSGGYRHIPDGGSSGQTLVWAQNGNATWTSAGGGGGGSGTVTSVATSGAITGGTITSTGTISHSTSAPYKHIPTSGTSGQLLENDGSGIAIWADAGDHGTHGGSGGSHDHSSSYSFTGNNITAVGDLSVTGEIKAATGTESSPTYSFTDETNTGMYRLSSTLKWSLLGDDTMQLLSTGLTIIGSNLQIKDGSTTLPVRDGTDGEVEVQYGNSGFFYKVSSSERGKMNIRDLDVDSSAVYSLVPKSYEGKAKVFTDNVGWEETGEAGGTQFGLIAEEVEQVLPALVTYDEEHLPNNVDYKLISVLLVEEMKKLKDRIEVLEGN